jgi:hypothetical protein
VIFHNLLSNSRKIQEKGGNHIFKIKTPKSNLNCKVVVVLLGLEYANFKWLYGVRQVISKVKELDVILPRFG